MIKEPMSMYCPICEKTLLMHNGTKKIVVQNNAQLTVIYKNLFCLHCNRNFIWTTTMTATEIINS